MLSSVLAMALVWPLAAAALIPVEGDTQCPTPAAVAAELGQLIGPEAAPDPAAAGEPRLRVVLRRGAGAGAGTGAEAAAGPGSVVTVELRAGDELRASRQVPANASCQHLARAVAVVVAVWQRLHSSGAEATFPAPVPAAPVPVVPAPDASLSNAGSGSPRRSLGLDVGVAFMASLSGGAGVSVPGGSTTGAGLGGGRIFSPGAALELSFGTTGGFGLRAAVEGADRRSFALSSGEATWTRITGSLGPRYRWLWRRVALDVHAEVHLGGALAAGTGLTADQSDAVFEVGLGGGLRAAWRAGRFWPFLGARIAGWPLAHELVVQGQDGRFRLPQIDVGLSAGVAYATF